MGGITPALGLYCFSACIANIFAAVRSNENKKLMTTDGLKERIGSTGNQFAISTLLGTGDAPPAPPDVRCSVYYLFMKFNLKNIDFYM